MMADHNQDDSPNVPTSLVNVDQPGPTGGVCDPGPKYATRRKTASLQVVRTGAPAAAETDLVAVEEPLEIRLAGETVAVIMRTPGEDHLLALGYLFAEGLIARAEDAAAVFHCGRLGDEGYGNTVEVSPASGARIAWERLDASRRGGVPPSAGRASRSAGVRRAQVPG